MNVQLLSQTFQLSTVVNQCLRRPVPSPNPFDACLEEDFSVWNDLLSGGNLQKICCPKGRRPYTQKPWIAMPKEGCRFKKISSISLPAAPFTFADIEVLNEKVPLGYDGVIQDIVCEVTSAGATGFIEGSGDIVWRLSAQGEVGSDFRRYLRDLGNITTTLGSLIYPSPTMMGAWRVFSGDDIIFSAAFAVGAEGVLTPDDKIICSVSGWFYPR